MVSFLTLINALTHMNWCAQVCGKFEFAVVPLCIRGEEPASLCAHAGAATGECYLVLQNPLIL